MSESRSDRIRRRRQGRDDEPDEPSDTSKPSEPAEQSEPVAPGEPSEPDESAETDETAETDEQSDADEGDEGDEQSVKDEQVGTYMYLPEGQHDRLTNTYNLLKAKYEAEYGVEFEKNRHFFPLVVRYGLDRLDGADASDVRTLLDGLE